MAFPPLAIDSLIISSRAIDFAFFILSEYALDSTPKISERFDSKVDINPVPITDSPETRPTYFVISNVSKEKPVVSK